jgi:hypothetical protein
MLDPGTSSRVHTFAVWENCLWTKRCFAPESWPS